MKALAVYCGSATPADPVYMDAARQVGRELAMREITVVYGGGRLGLMGAVADSALAAGGQVIGVIPEALTGSEVAHRGCTELHVVNNMHDRKAMFTRLADGFINLPGGVGTMDEMWEAASWAQLGYHDKPVGVLNIAGYYNHLIAFNAHMADVGFVRDAHRGILLVADELPELLAKMTAYVPHKTIFQMKALDL
jgi:uncharacterized protein (TIGR00730 family)